MGLSPKEMTAGMMAALEKVTNKAKDVLTPGKPKAETPDTKILGSGMARKAGDAIRDRNKANEDALNY